MISRVSPVGILCRGTSVVMASKYFGNIEDIIVVNSFEKELENQSIKEIFSNKNITHILCREYASIMHPKTYRKYGINNMVLNIFEKEFRAGTLVRKTLELNGFSPKFLPIEMEPHQKPGGGFPTTGVLSVVYATKVIKSKEIHIAGMDFYQKDYLIKKSKDYQKKKGELMVDFMMKFVKNNPSTKYIFYTHSNFNCDFGNVEIVNE